MEESNINLSNVFVLKGYFTEDYSWQNFINCINDAYDINNPNNNSDGIREKLGKINFWQKLTLTLDNVDETNFSGVEFKSHRLAAILSTPDKKRKCTGYFGAVSFTDKEPTTGKHSDPIDVIYCQFVGSVRWDIFYESGTQSFILEPGDIIYVPKSIMHEVVSLSPRAALSFMFGEK